MSDITHILAKIESGDRLAAEQLLPLVYEELRRLAAAKLAHEKASLFAALSFRQTPLARLFFI